MQQEKVFRLPSGPEAVVVRYTGAVQSALSNDSVPFQDRLINMIIIFTKRIGEYDFDTLTDKEKKEVIGKLLLCDRKALLVESRQHSYSEDPDFIFTYNYKSVAPATRGLNLSFEMHLPLGEGFPIEPVKRFDAALLAGVRTPNQIRALSAKVEPAQFDKYDEVLANAVLKGVLPIAGKKIQLRMRDGLSEAIATAAKITDSHLSILMANPQWIDERTETAINFQWGDLQKLDSMDLEYMRGLLKIFEGRVDTELKFEHPEAEYLKPNEKEVVSDLLGQIAFFYPTEQV